MMSDQPPPVPSQYYPPPPRRSRVGLVFLWLVLLASIGLNLLFCCGGSAVFLGHEVDVIPLGEKFHSGSQSAKDKVAVVRLEGVIIESGLNFVYKQIEKAVAD